MKILIEILKGFGSIILGIFIIFLGVGVYLINPSSPSIVILATGVVIFGIAFIIVGKKLIQKA